VVGGHSETEDRYCVTVVGPWYRADKAPAVAEQPARARCAGGVAGRAERVSRGGRKAGQYALGLRAKLHDTVLMLVRPGEPDLSEWEAVQELAGRQEPLPQSLSRRLSPP
jgi:hypothetical protein